MILDSGICTVFHKVNTSPAGRMPVYGYELLGKGWFKSLDFTNAPRWQTEKREEVNISKRIRILQDARITNHDVVFLSDVDEIEEGELCYEVIRAFHGTEDGTGTPITDLSLEVTIP